MGGKFNLIMLTTVFNTLADSPQASCHLGVILLSFYFNLGTLGVNTLTANQRLDGPQ